VRIVPIASDEEEEEEQIPDEEELEEPEGEPDEEEEELEEVRNTKKVRTMKLDFKKTKTGDVEAVITRAFNSLPPCVLQGMVKRVLSENERAPSRSPVLDSCAMVFEATLVK
jgi:hypothetical protein